jgi:hypothetical protein
MLAVVISALCTVVFITMVTALLTATPPVLLPGVIDETVGVGIVVVNSPAFDCLLSPYHGLGL